MILVKHWPLITKAKFLVLGYDAVSELSKNRQKLSSVRKKWLSRKF